MTDSSQQVAAGFVSELTVQNSMLDVFGHVNNVAFFRVLEDARWLFMSRDGADVRAAVKQTNIGPVILEANARFRRELKYREHFTIETGWQTFEKKVGRLRQVIRNLEGEACCVTDFTMALVELTQRKIVLPDARWKEILGLP